MCCSGNGVEAERELHRTCRSDHDNSGSDGAEVHPHLNPIRRSRVVRRRKHRSGVNVIRLISFVTDDEA
jgi:hypothetical protein